MKILILITSLFIAPSFAATPVISQVEQSNANPVAQEKWMKQRSGRILVFDKSQGVVIVNRKAYSLTKDTKIYDGYPKKGSSVKFNLNKDNQVTELWIVNK